MKPILLRRRPAIALAAMTMVISLGLTACGSDEPTPASGQAASRPPGVPIQVPASSTPGPGTVSWAQTMPTLDRRLSSTTALAARVEYASTNGDGRPTTVSGAIFVPKGTAPDGGVPIVAFGHGTVGVLNECGPTLDPKLRGAADLVSVLLAKGYAVSMTDYEGLGTPDDDAPTHPYLDGETEGRNIIDSVRAMRQMSSAVSDRWAALGLSQGGQAVWSANILAATYGTGIDLVGTVSLSPPVDISGLAAKAYSSQLTVDQYGLYQWLLLALKHEDNSLDLDRYRRGSATKNWTALSQCEGRFAADRQQAVDALTPGDLRPDSPDARDDLRKLLKKRGLPPGKPSAPILVMYGGKDTLIDSGWTTAVLEATCDAGATITGSFQPDAGHADVDPSFALYWLDQRFAGKRLAAGCTNV